VPAAAVPSRLPATLLSRCQRVRIAAPERAQSLAWLNAQRPHADWARALVVLGDAPLAALASDPAAIVELHTETLVGLGDALRGAADPPSLAERWSRGDLGLHLRSIETWLTDRIRERSGVPPESQEVRGAAYLSESRSDLNIRWLFELLDAVRELASLLDTPLNRALATEELIWRFAGARELRDP
jgi:DNA polymerase-3 subunit delta'